MGGHHRVPERHEEDETHVPDAHALAASLRSRPNEREIQEQAIRTSRKVEEVGQLTAPEEETVDPNLRKLVDAVWEGRRITVLRNGHTGKFDVFAAAPQPAAQTQAEKAVSQQPRPRASSTNKNSSSSGWETVQTAFKEADSRPEGSNEQSVKADSSSFGKRPVRPDTVVRATADGLETHHITPIQIEYGHAKKRRPQTPSIRSKGSEFDCSSPLFSQSCETAIRTGRDLGKMFQHPDCIADLSSDGSEEDAILRSRVLKWLDDVNVKELSPAEKANHQKLVRQIKKVSDAVLSPPRKAFTVMRDVPGDPKCPQPSWFPVRTSNVLKDISNIRRPGHPANIPLGDSKSNQENRDAIIPKPGLSQTAQVKATARKVDYEALGTAIHPGIVQFKRPLTPIEYLQAKTAKEQAEREGSSGSVEVERTAISIKNTQYLFSFESNCERRAHLDFTLARLEGRASPNFPSPVRRYVDPLGHYSENVEWEQRSTRLLQPVPWRPKQTGIQIHHGVEEMRTMEVNSQEERMKDGSKYEAECEKGCSEAKDGSSWI